MLVAHYNTICNTGSTCLKHLFEGILRFLSCIPILVFIISTLNPFYGSSQTRQTVQLRGCTIDKDTYQPLSNTTVKLVLADDSTFVLATFSDTNGNFILDGLVVGNYKILVAYIGYQSHIQAVQITATSRIITLDTIGLQNNGLFLKEVEIRETAPSMTIKHDTVEFNASAFKTRQNALMEELLKKLPGLLVTKEGSVIMRGEIIKKVLIDGKPFFGDGTRLAIQNLPADMIDKVQIIDRKVDEAGFAGANYGKTEKVLNITIRAARKNSFFGQTTAGYGTDSRFAANANLNRFGNRQQFTILGGGNNINLPGSFQDGGTTPESPLLNSNANNDGGDNGNGITRNWNSGINYNSTPGKKIKWSGSYFVTDHHLENHGTSARQNLLSDSSSYYNEQSVANRDYTRFNLNTRMDYQIDSMHTLTIMPNFQYGTGDSYQFQTYSTLSSKQEPVNIGTTSITGKSCNPRFFSVAAFRKKFKNARRAFNASLNYYYSGKEQETFNRSHNIFIQPVGAKTEDSINQRSDISILGRTTELNFIYWEPLARDLRIEFTYSHAHNYASSGKFTYNYNATKGSYDLPNDSLSNSFEAVFSTHQIGISLHQQKAKYAYGIGMNLQTGDLRTKDLTSQTAKQRHLIRFYPMAFLLYELSSNKRLRFTYSGSVLPPTIQELQPVPDNNDPLYIQLGNPDLEPSFNHTLFLEYNTFNTTTLRNFFINLIATSTSDKISYDNRFDSLGRQVSQPLNVNGTFNIALHIANTIPIKKLGTVLNSSTAFNFNHDINLLNGKISNINNFNFSQRLGLNYRFKEVCDYSVAISGNYYGSRYSIQKKTYTDFITYTFSFGIQLTLPLGLMMGTDLETVLNRGFSEGYNKDVNLVNIFVSKTVFKNKKGLIKIQGFDLLRQNLRNRRNVGENFIEDVQSKILQRYFMLGFSYFPGKSVTRLFTP